MCVAQSNVALLAALRQVIDLPTSIVSLRLELNVDQMPTLELVHHVEVDVTKLDSTAREFALGTEQVFRRYKLTEA